MRLISQHRAERGVLDLEGLLAGTRIECISIRALLVVFGEAFEQLLRASSRQIALLAQQTPHPSCLLVWVEGEGRDGEVGVVATCGLRIPDAPKHSINLMLSLLMLKSGSVNVLYEATSRSSRHVDIFSLMQVSRKKWCSDSFAKFTQAWPED